MGTWAAAAVFHATHLHLLQPLQAPSQGREAGLHHGDLHLEENRVISCLKASLEKTAVMGTRSLPASPHLLLEALVVHIIHTTAGKGLQVIPALTAEQPYIPKLCCEVTQAFLEVGRVLQG